MRMRHIINCGLYGSITFLRIISQTARLSKKYATERTTCVLISSENFIWTTSHSKKTWAGYDQNGYGINVKNPLFLSDFNETWIFSTDFRKIP